MLHIEDTSTCRPVGSSCPAMAASNGLKIPLDWPTNFLPDALEAVQHSVASICVAERFGFGEACGHEPAQDGRCLALGNNRSLTSWPRAAVRRGAGPSGRGWDPAGSGQGASAACRCWVDRGHRREGQVAARFSGGAGGRPLPSFDHPLSLFPPPRSRDGSGCGMRSAVAASAILSIVARSMACRWLLLSGRFERAREADAITRSNMRMRAKNWRRPECPSRRGGHAGSRHKAVGETARAAPVPALHAPAPRQRY